MIVPRTFAAPTPFGSERAKQIWDARGPQWSLRLAPGEDEYVRQIWESMSDSACWIDAFLRILNDKVEAAS